MSDAFQPDLVHRRRDLVARGAVLDHEVRDLAFAGQRRDRDALRDLGPRVRDEHLGAVHDPAVVAQGRRRAGRARIGARVGLGQPERREPLAAGERGEPPPLLLLGAEQEERHRAERRVGCDRDRDGRVDSRELLDRDRVTQRIAAGTAELLGERDPHQPELGHLGDELVGEAAFAVELLGDGRDAFDGEGAHGVAEQLLLGREVEIHAQRSYPDGAFEPDAAPWPGPPLPVRPAVPGARARFPRAREVDAAERAHLVPRDRHTLTSPSLRLTAIRRTPAARSRSTPRLATCARRSTEGA